MTKEDEDKLRRAVARIKRERNYPSWEPMHRDYSKSKPIVERMLSSKSMFCTSLVANGILSEQQMLDAAERYRLGESRWGWTVFWQIDHEGCCRDGRCIYYTEECLPDPTLQPQWASDLMFRQCELERPWPINSCLFGLHLLNAPSPVASASREERIVAVVRRESTAVVMSERLPGIVWMAVGAEEMLRTDLFLPLQGRRVIVFPEHTTVSPLFVRWQQTCLQAGRQMGQVLTISERILL